MVVHPRMHLFGEKPAGAVAPARTHGRRVNDTKGGNTLLRNLLSYSCTHRELRYPLDVPYTSHRRPCLARHSLLARVSTARVAPSLLCTINCDFPTTSLHPYALLMITMFSSKTKEEEGKQQTKKSSRMRDIFIRSSVSAIQLGVIVLPLSSRGVLCDAEIKVWQHPRQGVSFACEPKLRWGAYRL